MVDQIASPVRKVFSLLRNLSNMYLPEFTVFLLMCSPADPQTRFSESTEGLKFPAEAETN